ncbi:MAG: hypothetical protein ACOYIG_08950 [Acetivibrionales bacterium]|nr:hypothetical protein [Anaerohalosphaeraceae bacterium]HRT51327.1 hypothetical protein [Anaerohalosphaeraceae bacterium]HRT88228.1 hypothetical protein [Anaerohalosphaeraceae bacterium]
MADLLQAGSDWLQAKRKAFMAQPVIYSRGAEQITVNATLGRTRCEVEDEYGLRVKAEVMDFLIGTDELTLSGGPALPRTGDQIRIERNAATEVFEVMALGGIGHWQYSDPYGRTFRIHTRQINTE